MKNYSGGMKRRLNIAVAMLHNPSILILDEPTVGVDAQSRQHIFDYIQSLAEQRNDDSLRRTIWRKSKPV